MGEEDNKFVEKTTVLKKAQPVKLWTQLFSKGFKVGVEFNFNPYDPNDMDELVKVDSDLRTSIKNFIKMYSEITGSELIA